MDEKPTIDEEARRLDLRPDERDIGGLSITSVVIVIAVILILVLLGMTAFLGRYLPDHSDV